MTKVIQNIVSMKKIILLSALFVMSCTEGFEEINRNPNASENIEPEYLLTNVLTVTASRNTYEQGFRLSNFLTQFSSDIEFERIDRYEMGSNSSWWNGLYRMVTDINSMQSVPATNDAFIAVGDILKSYIYANLTDMWGDVPYSEAGQAKDGLTQPAYDKQQDIYLGPNGILARLEAAVKVLKNSNSTIRGDVLFGNDLEKWIRFANALQIRYTMRISNKLNDFSKLQAIVNEGNIMRGQTDNAVIPYLSAPPNQFPLSQSALGIYNGHRMSETVGNFLLQRNDPRIEVLFKPTAKSLQEGKPAFKGLRNGLTRESIAQQGIDLNDISLFGAKFRDVPNGVDAQYMLFAEQQLALAEAVERGYINGNAKTYYESGIQAHFDYLGVPVPENYLSQNSVVYGSNNLEKILSQKWLVLMTNGHEAWFEVRRTGIPALTPGPDNLNDDRYPRRYLYPEGEQATNSDNYKAALQSQGPDDINTKVWWEKL